ncbi:MAG: MBL fold metallo-hydrolase [Verrucomicrobiae bacterium]|nr:MBL fold metallo-hydrolase [Verrucomicrobiae bacterium]
MGSFTMLEANDLPGDRIPAPDGEVIVHPVSHATLVLGWKDKIVYVDPVGGASRFSNLPKPHIVLVTHIHSDHFDPATLRAVITTNTAIICPKTVAERLPAELAKQAILLTNSQSTEVHGIKVEAVPAYNLTQERLVYHEKGRDNGYVLNLGGLRVYVSGDTEAVPEMLALKEIGVAFVCMNLPYTMDAAQAARAVRAFKPKIVYPYHCRGANLEEFKQQIGTDLNIEVRLRNWYP